MYSWKKIESSSCLHLYFYCPQICLVLKQTGWFRGSIYVNMCHIIVLLLLSWRYTTWLWQQTHFLLDLSPKQIVTCHVCLNEKRIILKVSSTQSVLHLYTFKWFLILTKTQPLLYKGVHPAERWGLRNRTCGLGPGWIRTEVSTPGQHSLKGRIPRGFQKFVWWHMGCVTNKDGGPCV